MKHIHGGNIYQYGKVLDFSANLNPLGMPEAVRLAAKEGVDASDHYPDPDCTALREALSGAEGIPSENIICGNGAAELIFLLVQARRPERALLAAPSFAEYGEALSACGAELVYYPMKFSAQAEAKESGEGPRAWIGEDYLELLTEEIDMAFLCNPNNPTGALCRREFLEQVLKRCREKDILLVLDECFLDFLADKAAYEMKSYMADGGLFILKAFTKLYAMAGLRLGYGMSGNRELLETMSCLRQPWSVSVPAQRAGIAALGEAGFAARTAAYVAVERTRLFSGLKDLGLSVFPGEANFLFFWSGRTDLKETLLRRGFLIRDCSNYQGLEPGFYRIAVRTAEENSALLAAMKEELRWQKH